MNIPIKDEELSSQNFALLECLLGGGIYAIIYQSCVPVEFVEEQLGKLARYLVNIYKQKNAILIEILLTLGANYFDLEGKLSRVIFHCFG